MDNSVDLSKRPNGYRELLSFSCMNCTHRSIEPYIVSAPPGKEICDKHNFTFSHDLYTRDGVEWESALYTCPDFEGYIDEFA